MEQLAARPQTSTTSTPAPPEKVSLYSWYVLGFLFVVSTFNSIDRSIITVLQVPMQHELGLSDSQLGALTGLAFGLLYTLMGVPIALLADRTSRRAVLSIAVTVWSIMTASCGLAWNFSTLFMARMGTGASEAAGNPTSHALIADHFPPSRRGMAMGVYGLGIPFGKMLGLGAAGWIVHLLGWRHGFVIFGAVGALLGPVAYFTLRETSASTQRVKDARAGTFHVPLGRKIRTLWELRTFRFMALGGMGKQLTMYTVLSWNVPFYVRVQHLSIVEAASYLALMTGVGGGIGIFMAGYIADRLGRADKRWYAWVPGLAALGAFFFGMIQYLTSSLPLSIACGTMTLMLIQAHLAPVVATVQSLVSTRMRAFASAMLTLVSAIIGMCFGPLVTGWISDYLIHNYGMNENSLRYAIATMLFFALFGAFAYWLASRHIRAELEAARLNDPA